MKVTARATRTQGWWAVEVPEVDGAFTQARRLDQVPAMVRDAVALLEGVSPDSIEVEVLPQISQELTSVMAIAKDQRVESERLARSASDLLASVAKLLSVEEELSLRDVGVILGISHQRVAQIIAGPQVVQQVRSSISSQGRPKRAASSQLRQVSAAKGGKGGSRSARSGR